ncbi:acyltransferase family protein [Clostridium sp.]|uniref:acyltransferase family protein n=1 Tax=Clostridium sp. TaxID=1506 RepID=UPI003F33CA53
MKKYKKEQRERNFLLDNLKVLLMFCVVFGHVIEYYIDQSDFLKSVYIFIYIFHMPLFVYISGYLSKDVNKVRKGAIKGLLVPYIIFNMIWYTAVYIGTKEVMFSILYPGWTLWYLLSLFFWRISLKYLVKIKGILIFSFIFGLLIGMMPGGEAILSVSRTITFLPFFLLGYYSKEENLRKMQGLNKAVSSLIILGFFICAVVVVKNDLVGYKFLYNSQSYYSSGLTTIQGMYFRSLLYIAAIIFGACVINLTPSIKVFYSKIGKGTMNIYVFHIYLVLLVYFFIPKWNMGPIRNVLLLCSPFLIIYILSKRKVDKMYDGIFDPVNKGLSEGKKSFKRYIS